jgi:urea ABC transporter ATP-binding protein UrtE
MLRIEGLHSGYGASEVLHGVDLTVEPGETLALLGRNGMGKTTLLRAVMGLLPARRGRVLVEGRDVTGWPPHRIARLGLAYVPQGREIFAELTVEENLLLGVLGRAPGQRGPAARVFDWFPLLADRRRQRAGTLSGGQQQMLALGRALAVEPRLLLLDEPSEGIQPSLVHQIGATLRRIAGEAGIALLLVEQNVDLVTLVAGRCAFLDNGVVVETCPTALLAQPDAAQRRHLAL